MTEFLNGHLKNGNTIYCFKASSNYKNKHITHFNPILNKKEKGEENKRS